MKYLLISICLLFFIYRLVLLNRGGAIIGGVFGAIVGYGGCIMSEENVDFTSFWSWAAAGTIIKPVDQITILGVLLGAALGAILGALIKK